MTDMNQPDPPPERDASTPPKPYPAQPVESLTRWFEANRGRFTDEALGDAARQVGYPDQAIEGAMALVRAHETAAPIRRRARQAIIAAYLLTFAALVIGTFSSELTRRSGMAEVSSAILAVTMFLALLASLAWLGSRRPTATGQLAFTGLLAVPVILLVVVAGLCVATGLPIPRAYDAGPGYAPVEGDQPPVPAEP